MAADRRAVALGTAVGAPLVQSMKGSCAPFYDRLFERHARLLFGSGSVDEELDFDETMREMTMNGAKKSKGTIGKFHTRSRMSSTTVVKMNKHQLEHIWCYAPVLNARVANKDLSKNCET
ncbi:hypothetical protein Sjap_017835 [Stephania japonica]|uniref:Uncharacterized protein n=1 Tax=Stephania japonica TaxID=461633 RepID=A0AAP0I6X5_9MAGN